MLYLGTVILYAPESEPGEGDELWRIKFDDDDEEDFDEKDLEKGIALYGDREDLMSQSGDDDDGARAGGGGSSSSSRKSSGAGSGGKGAKKGAKGASGAGRRGKGQAEKDETESDTDADDAGDEAAEGRGQGAAGHRGMLGAFADVAAGLADDVVLD